MNGITGLNVQVQSDHYEDFYAPELEKHGYTGVYKKKTGEVSYFGALHKFWLRSLKPFNSMAVVGTAGYISS